MGGNPRSQQPQQGQWGTESTAWRAAWGWETIQDGIYTAHPVRTFDLPGQRVVRPSEQQGPFHSWKAWVRVSAQARGARGHTQKAWVPPEKVMAGLSLGPPSCRDHLEGCPL